MINRARQHRYWKPGVTSSLSAARDADHWRPRLVLLAVFAWVLAALAASGCVRSRDKQICAAFCEQVSGRDVYPLSESVVDGSEVLHYPWSSEPRLCICSLAFRPPREAR